MKHRGFCPKNHYVRNNIRDENFRKKLANMAKIF